MVFATTNFPAIVAFPVGCTDDIVPSIRIADEVLLVSIAVGPDGKVYVTYRWRLGYHNEIAVYAGGTNGNVAPIATLSGPHTGLRFPSAIAVDARGAIYAANGRGDSITIYAPNSRGDATPIATISGSTTWLGGPEAIALDSQGKIYVANTRGGFMGTGGITIYPAGSHGDASPIATIAGTQTGLVQPYSIAVDTRGRIYAVDSGGIKIYGRESNGDVAPIANLAKNTRLDEPRAIVPDASGKLYVANTRAAHSFEHQQSLTVYYRYSGAEMTPVCTIAGKNTGFAYPGDIAVDSGGKIYVIANGKVIVYAAGSNGNVKPSPLQPSPARTPGSTTALGALRLDWTGKYMSRTAVMWPSILVTPMAMSRR